MRLEYAKLSPTGNVTVLVRTPVPRALQGEVAARLLDGRCVGGEQVGYIEPATDLGARARLQMMGGEFCGNATMSLGALLARSAGADDLALRLEVSGSPGPVACRILRDGDGWVGTVDMPLPEGISERAVHSDAGLLTVPLVRMPGIAHLLLPAEAGLSEEQLRRRLPEWNRDIAADALGALILDARANAIDPLVYVPSAGTLVREHGCGSGSAAVGCWLAARAGHSLTTPVSQPGGTITVRAETEGARIAAVAITGRVTVVEEGTVEL